MKRCMPDCAHAKSRPVSRRLIVACGLLLLAACVPGCAIRPHGWIPCNQEFDACCEKCQRRVMQGPHCPAHVAGVNCPDGVSTHGILEGGLLEDVADRCQCACESCAGESCDEPSCGCPSGEGCECGPESCAAPHCHDGKCKLPGCGLYEPEAGIFNFCTPPIALAGMPPPPPGRFFPVPVRPVFSPQAWGYGYGGGAGESYGDGGACR
jgi:hypothetical protein